MVGRVPDMVEWWTSRKTGPNRDRNRRFRPGFDVDRIFRVHKFKIKIIIVIRVNNGWRLRPRDRITGPVSETELKKRTVSSEGGRQGKQ